MEKLEQNQSNAIINETSISREYLQVIPDLPNKHFAAFKSFIRYQYAKSMPYCLEILIVKGLGEIVLQATGDKHI